jgi:hypothetical protein
MAPFGTLLRRTALAPLSLLVCHEDDVAGPAATEPDAGWSFYHSSDDLLSGLEVMEHSAPPALLGLLQEMLAA